MDGTRFDGLTRALAGAKTRRGALAAAMAALAAGAGASRQEAEAINICRLPGMECGNDTQCCSRICTDGACACIESGRRCYQLGLACCSKRCRRGRCK